MNQKQAAIQAMNAWLSHPGELGRAPAKLECTGTFSLGSMTYYMFRFKRGRFDKTWLLGVCGGYEEGEVDHCGHVFSEMQPYDAANEERDARRMVETIMEYWRQRAKEYGQAGQDTEPAR